MNKKYEEEESNSDDHVKDHRLAALPAPLKLSKGSLLRPVIEISDTGNSCLCTPEEPLLTQALMPESSRDESVSDPLGKRKTSPLHKDLPEPKRPKLAREGV